MNKRHSSSNKYPSIDLRGMEEEVLAEGKKWMQRRLEKKLRERRKSFSPGGGKDTPVPPAPEVDGANSVW
jgi:hypothetical protein